MGKKFDISQADEIAEYLETATGKAAVRAMRAVAARVVSTIQTEVIPKLDPKPVDRGLYRASWKHRSVDSGAEVYNTAPYASIIEYGARAANIKIGKKMIDALTAWVKRKGLVKGKGKAALADARGIAWAIATKMKQRGIFGPKGLRVLEKGAEKAEEFFREELDREISRALK